MFAQFALIDSRFIELCFIILFRTCFIFAYVPIQRGAMLERVFIAMLHASMSLAPTMSARLDERQTGFEKALVRDCHDQQLPGTKHANYHQICRKPTRFCSTETNKEHRFHQNPCKAPAAAAGTASASAVVTRCCHYFYFSLLAIGAARTARTLVISSFDSSRYSRGEKPNSVVLATDALRRPMNRCPALSRQQLQQHSQQLQQHAQQIQQHSQQLTQQTQQCQQQSHKMQQQAAQLHQMSTQIQQQLQQSQQVSQQMTQQSQQLQTQQIQLPQQVTQQLQQQLQHQFTLQIQQELLGCRVDYVDCTDGWNHLRHPFHRWPP